MTTKTKTGPAPASSADLCDACPPFALHPTATSFGCEHGLWTFNPDPPPTPAEEQLSDLLDSLTADQLQVLLDAKTGPAPVVEPESLAEPVKATKSTAAGK